MTLGAARVRIVQVAGIAAGALLVGFAPPAFARQSEGGFAVTPPISPIEPIPAAPWDLAPWTAVGLVAVALCTALAWWIAGRTASAPDPSDDDPDAA